MPSTLLLSYRMYQCTVCLARICVAGLALLFLACEEEEEKEAKVLSSAKELTSFSFLVENNPELIQDDLVFTVLNNRINAMFPRGQRTDSLVATFNTNAVLVTVDSIEQISDSTHNNFTQPVTYHLQAEDSTTVTYVVRSHTYTGVPVVKIITENRASIVSKDDYIDAKMTIIANAMGEEDLGEVDIEIRGRGNTTWTMPKKPYRIKLAESAKVLGMPKDKSWVLLANYPDKTLMRNYIAFKLSAGFGLEYTPRSQFVDLYLNDVYQGNYQLVEQIKVDKNRVAIHELTSADIAEDAITGGYLLLIDGRSDEDFRFRSTGNVPFIVKSPEKGTTEQYNYIQNYVQTTEDVLFSEDFADPQQGYAQYIDVRSFVDWYLVNELTKNTDAKFANSVYMHKPQGGKLVMGPVWDFDIGFGNVDYSPGEFPEGWYVREASWLARLFQDPQFEQRVKSRWKEMRPVVQDIIDGIDKDAAYLQQSQGLNFTKWQILNRRVWPNPVVTGSYAGEVDYLKDWLTKRARWMDRELD